MPKNRLVKISTIGVLVALSCLLFVACGQQDAPGRVAADQSTIPTEATPDLPVMIAAAVAEAIANPPTPTAVPNSEMQSIIAEAVKLALAARSEPSSTPVPTPNIQAIVAGAVTAALASQPSTPPELGPAPDIQAMMAEVVKATLLAAREPEVTHDGEHDQNMAQDSQIEGLGTHDEDHSHLSFATMDRTPSTAVNFEYSSQWSTVDGDRSIAPIGVAVDAQGVVYVTDDLDDRVQVYDSSGVHMFTWGIPGSDVGQLDSPFGIAVSAAGLIYVTEIGNFRVQVFNADGESVGTLGVRGTANGQFLAPVGIAIGPQGKIYVTDAINDRVQVFSDNGKFMFRWGTQGTRNGEFNAPIGIAVDSEGMVYVADHGNNRVQVFDQTGKFVSKWGTLGAGNGEFNSPFGVAVNEKGQIFVTDTHVGNHSSVEHNNSNHRVQVFSSNGDFLGNRGTPGGDDGQFSSPFGLALDSAGNIYVADHDNGRIQVFN